MGEVLRHHDGEIDRRPGDAVQIVREDVERDEEHGLDDFRIGEPGAARGIECGIVDVATLLVDGDGERQQRGRARIGGLRGSRRRERLPVDAVERAERGVCREAVAAAVSLGDGECDLLAPSRRP